MVLYTCVHTKNGQEWRKDGVPVDKKLVPDLAKRGAKCVNETGELPIVQSKRFTCELQADNKGTLVSHWYDNGKEVPVKSLPPGVASTTKCSEKKKSKLSPKKIKESIKEGVKKLSPKKLLKMG